MQPKLINKGSCFSLYCETRLSRCCQHMRNSRAKHVNNMPLMPAIMPLRKKFPTLYDNGVGKFGFLLPSLLERGRG